MRSALVLVCAVGAAVLFGEVPRATAQIITHPDISESHIAFAASGDIWVVDKQGGRPRRLSPSDGDDDYPRFSPDGGRIAFSAPDGVHVVSATGGATTRLTFHPAPTKVVDWTPDGKGILFVSGQDSPLPYRFGHLFRVSAAGGLPERLPYAQAEHAAVSPDGKTIALQPEARQFFVWSDPLPWKRYRGGKAPDVWLIDVTTNKAHNVTRHRANDESPVWVGDRLLFLSDRGPGKRSDVWAYDRRRRTTRRLTHVGDVDIAAIGASAVDAVFVAAGRLHVLEVSSGRTRHVPLEFETSPVQTRIVRPVAPIQQVRISPDGALLVAEARGEIFLIPTQEGQSPRNLTNSSGTAERSPEWSPDGRTVAYVTDRTGEYQIAAYSIATGSETILSAFRSGYPQHLRWAPDSRRLAFVDEQRRLNIFDTASRTHVVTQVLAATGVQWSPDGRWIACTRRLPNSHTAIFLYDTGEHLFHQVTSGTFQDSEPVFDAKSRTMYFLTARSFTTFAYSALEDATFYPNSTVVATLRLPIAWPAPEGGQLERHAALLPLPPGNYADLRATASGILVRRLPRTGGSDNASPLLHVDVGGDGKEQVISPNAQGYDLAAGGASTLVWRGPRYEVFPRFGDTSPSQPLRTTELEMQLTPKEEWRQIFHDAWRLTRDFLYDPDMRGLDWQRVGQRYATRLVDVTTRSELTTLLADMLGELGVSHVRVGGGDAPQAAPTSVRLLGADFASHEGHVRVSRVLEGAPWDLELRSPLATSGVTAGAYLLGVNGQRVNASRDLHATLVGVGATVTLTVSDGPTLAGSRDVIVSTLLPAQETRLRYLDWVETNRRRVDAASKGALGYVHVPNTASAGNIQLLTMSRAQSGKSGVIVDARFNSGGSFPSALIEQLARRRRREVRERNGTSIFLPTSGLPAVQVLVVNGATGSGGDSLAWLFRESGLGTVVGSRTWGGLVGWNFASPSLIDGGFVRIPAIPIHALDGRLLVEGRGVQPDVIVDANPGLLARGGDPQLQRAIAVATARIQSAKRKVRPFSAPSLP